MSIKPWQAVTDVDPEDYYYEPLYFVRSHCEPKDPGNSVTQIWDVVFEPGNSDCVATCGGRYLCVFKVSTGQLMLKYTHAQRSHELFTLSWTILAEDMVMLASGSASGEIRLFHPARQVSFHHWSVGRGVAVYAVKFHTNQPSWMFVGSNNSEVGLWDIGDPRPPHYNCRPRQLVRLVADSGDIYSMAWVTEEEWLMVGTAEGLVGWKVLEEKVKEEMFPRYRPNMVKFRLPGGGDEPPYVDSVCSLGEGLVAAKCVGYGSIFVFKAKFKLKERQGRTSEVQVLMEFKWSKSDDFYMNIGGSSSLGLVACGDDKGTTWVYSLPGWLLGTGEEPDELPCRMLPLGKLPWPHVDVNSNELSKDTMLDKVTFSPCGQYLVCVTNTNIVAINRRVKYR